MRVSRLDVLISLLMSGGLGRPSGARRRDRGLDERRRPVRRSDVADHRLSAAVLVIRARQASGWCASTSSASSLQEGDHDSSPVAITSGRWRQSRAGADELLPVGRRRRLERSTDAVSLCAVPNRPLRHGLAEDCAATGRSVSLDDAGTLIWRHCGHWGHCGHCGPAGTGPEACPGKRG
jgi:hypothetical protein